MIFFLGLESESDPPILIRNRPCLVHLLCIRMFIKHLHLFYSYEIDVGSNDVSVANTGMILLEQRNLLVPAQTFKRFVKKSI